jgi:TRAP-type transport system small permease protein
MKHIITDSFGKRGVDLFIRVAASFQKVVAPVTKVLDKIGIVAFILLFCMLIYSVIARKLGYPLKGVIELSEFGMALVIFSFMAANYFKADQMTMDTFVEKLPSRVRHIIGSFVHLTNFIILGIMTWQMFSYGSVVQTMDQTSVNLRIPISPFVYFAAVCCVALTAVYIVHFLNSVAETSTSWRK